MKDKTNMVSWQKLLNRFNYGFNVSVWSRVTSPRGKRYRYTNIPWHLVKSQHKSTWTKALKQQGKDQISYYSCGGHLVISYTEA